MESEGTSSSYHFGTAEFSYGKDWDFPQNGSWGVITVEYPNGWYAKENRPWIEYQTIPFADFVYAELHTKKMLSEHESIDYTIGKVGKGMYAHTYKKPIPEDIKFIRYALSALEELTGGKSGGQNDHLIEKTREAVACPPMTQAATGKGIPKNASEALQAYNDWIEEAEEPARVVVENEKPLKTVVENLPTKEDFIEMLAEGLQTGLLRANALSVASEEVQVRREQEKMLLERNFTPAEIARLQNPTGTPGTVKNARQRISNDHNQK
jgi:hypothetical protein